ncbi:MAG: hypothetical protein JXD19_12845 [Deltaproteobacteria bacterium]|nr:hypothetical protein [Deltaproteobacteria bacterium]
MGIPSAPIEAEVFHNLGKMYAGLVGMPNHRIITVPHPISRTPAAACRDYINGVDPVTGKGVVDEIVDALTGPLSAEDMRSGSQERLEPRLIGPDTEENLQQLFIDNKWTDFLPIFLPTEERVEIMLSGTSHDPDEIVGELRSGYEALTFTVRDVAANAVMAGAKPEYMPVILTIAACGVPAISTSTQSFGRMIVINGPIRKEIGMNSGTGALSPMNRANSVLGRVATLISINLGAGGIPDHSYYGSQGNVTNYSNVTFAENEEWLPEGWKPFHVQLGYEAEESAMSIFHGYSVFHWKDTFEKSKIDSILNMSRRILPSAAYKSGLSLLLDPVVARDLVNEGFKTKESLSKYIYENTKLTLGEFWQYHLVTGFSFPMGQKGIEPYATWLTMPEETLITRYRVPEEISVLVVGGRMNDFWQAGDFHLIGSFCVDEWR